MATPESPSQDRGKPAIVLSPSQRERLRTARISLRADQIRGQKLVTMVLIVMAIGLLNRTRSTGSPTEMNAPHLRVSLDEAPPEVLMALPQIGPARMRAIVDERQRGPFSSIYDVDRRVKGIGPATAAEIEPYVRFATDLSSRP